MTLAVADVTGVVPAFDPAVTVAAIERIRTDIRAEVSDRVDPLLARLDGQVAQQRAINERLAARLDELTAGSDAPSTATDPALTPGLLAGVVLLAVLAGAAAGFVMAWTAGRGGPRPVEVEPGLSPASRGSRPA
jgi:hypothetical protein